MYVRQKKRFHFSGPGSSEGEFRAPGFRPVDSALAGFEPVDMAGGECPDGRARLHWLTEILATSGLTTV